MGMNCDAILCFGIRIEHGADLPWERDDFFGWYAQAMGGAPATVYNEDEDLLPEVTEEQETVYTKALESWMDSVPFEVVRHGYYDEPAYVLAVRGTKTTAAWCEPEMVDLTVPLNVPDLEAFAENYGIPVEGVVGWVLCSWWSH